MLTEPAMKELVRAPQNDKEWDRFNQYASRIREIYTYTYRGVLPELEVMLLLRDSLGGDRTLIPNLRTLRSPDRRS